MKRMNYKEVSVSDNYYVNKGKELLAEIERATGKNPIPLVVKSPPTSMQELVNPAEYLKNRDFS
jgi:hypothetical protein